MTENIMNAIPDKVDSTVNSLYTDYDSDRTKPYTAILGCKVENLNTVPDGMVGRSFDSVNYLNIKVKGDLTQGLLIKQWSKIWEMDLERRYRVDFEVFGQKIQNPKAGEVDFLVAVK